MLFRRRPNIAWREEKEARQEVVAALEEGREAADEGTLVLVDAGQVFELNLLGADIWKLCDGRRSVEEIVDELQQGYEVGRRELESDVRDFLEEMKERGWLLTE